MDTTPRLRLPFIAAAQAQKHVTHNEALTLLDDLVQLAVVAAGLDAPPPSPAEGARYIVGPAPTGAFAGRAHALAVRRDGAWSFHAPQPGWLAAIETTGVVHTFTGSAWVEAGASVTRLGVNASADTTNRLAVAAPAALFNHEGAGHQIKINKAAAANTASLVFQTGFSGRAEMGLAGSDDFSFKVSGDGAAWATALLIDRASGAVTLPATDPVALGVVRPSLLVNGCFRINQRGFPGGSLAAGAYGHDRWRAAAGGASYTVSSAGVVTLSSGELEQVVEPGFFGLGALAGLEVCVSVEAPGVDMTATVAGQSATITAGSGRRAATITLPAGATGNLVVRLRRSDAGAVTFSRVKLELGARASAFPARTTAEELALCRWTFVSLTNQQITLTNDTSVPRNIATLSWPPMRAAPSITIVEGGIVGQHTTAPALMTSAPTSAGFQWTGEAYRNLTGAGTVSVLLSAEP